MSPGQRIALYPGSFDPVTNGHLDIARRATRIFGEVIVGVLRNSGKAPLFSAEERAALFEESVREAGIHSIRVEAFEGLLVDFAARCGASVVVRGLRAISDFEYELQLAVMNRRLRPELETMFLTPGEDVGFISSRLVREIARFGGDVSGLVPPAAARALARRCGDSGPGSTR